MISSVLSLVVASSLLVQAPARETMLVLTDGHAFHGVVEKSTANAVMFRHRVGSQESITTFRAADIDPHSFYAIRAAAQGLSAADLIVLAKFAAEHQMYTEAMGQYGRAKAADPKLTEAFDKTELPTYLENLATRLVAEAKSALDEGDVDTAKKLTDDVLTRFTKTKAAESAKPLAKEIAEKSAKKAIETQAKSETGKRKCSSNESCMIALKNGTTVTGRIVESTDDSVTFAFKSNGTDVTTTLRARELDPDSFYEIRSADLGDDAAGHLTLGKYLVTQGMYAQARMHYEVAKSLDPGLVSEFDKTQLPKIREGIAARLLASAKKSVEAKRFEDAKIDASKILTLLFDTQAADEAKTLIDSVYQELAKRSLAETSAQVAEQDRDAAKKSEERMKTLLKPALEAREKGQKYNIEGLQSHGATTQAVQSFRQAAVEYKRALAALKAIPAQQDPEAVKTIERYRVAITEDLVDSYLNAGSIALTRSAIPEATDMANQALAVDPDNSQAKAFRARIENAANTDGRWPARWGRRR